MSTFGITLPFDNKTNIFFLEFVSDGESICEMLDDLSFINLFCLSLHLKLDVSQTQSTIKDDQIACVMCLSTELCFFVHLFLFEF